MAEMTSGRNSQESTYQSAYLCIFVFWALLMLLTSCVGVTLVTVTSMTNGFLAAAWRKNMMSGIVSPAVMLKPMVLPKLVLTMLPCATAAWYIAPKTF